MTHDFTSGQTSYLNMKVLAFAKDENMRSANLSYDPSVTTQTSSQLATLEPCIKAKVGRYIQARSQDFQKGGYLGVLCVCMHR